MILLDVILALGAAFSVGYLCGWPFLLGMIVGGVLAGVTGLRIRLVERRAKKVQRTGSWSAYD